MLWPPAGWRATVKLGAIVRVPIKAPPPQGGSAATRPLHMVVVLIGRGEAAVLPSPLWMEFKVIVAALRPPRVWGSATVMRRLVGLSPIVVVVVL
ncbi:unnamed protein product [Spirodela intermedia]|uniref:Uncharacterized protein n=2 Tax=Spirodela intermedia TaxID=51605 RepID=A0A7I8LLB9_SPIIN|nr:unnamed protein product [Spirodela intermedia]CAA6672883.1 unnamed protein product [Spirodela intermedia]CAA7410105.1 unnamed protein product [Spirodela intermedia]